MNITMENKKQKAIVAMLGSLTLTSYIFTLEEIKNEKPNYFR